tara:strand:- start:103 stop:645 length:543 start_codon:yes stop_codon:yes gene_type:complete
VLACGDDTQQQLHPASRAERRLVGVVLVREVAQRRRRRADGGDAALGAQIAAEHLQELRDHARLGRRVPVGCVGAAQVTERLGRRHYHSIVGVVHQQLGHRRHHTRNSHWVSVRRHARHLAERTGELDALVRSACGEHAIDRLSPVETQCTCADIESAVAIHELSGAASALEAPRHKQHV